MKELAKVMFSFILNLILIVILFVIGLGIIVAIFYLPTHYLLGWQDGAIAVSIIAGLVYFVCVVIKIITELD